MVRLKHLTFTIQHCIARMMHLSNSSNRFRKDNGIALAEYLKTPEATNACQCSLCGSGYVQSLLIQITIGIVVHVITLPFVHSGALSYWQQLQNIDYCVNNTRLCNMLVSQHRLVIESAGDGIYSLLGLPSPQLQAWPLFVLHSE